MSQSLFGVPNVLLFDDIFNFFFNFVSIKDVIRTCNLMVRFSKFILNINIYDEIVGFFSKLVWRETLFLL